MCNACKGTEIDPTPGVIALGEHVVRIYADSDSFMDSLVDFASVGLRAGEVVVAIATMSHLFELETRLREDGAFQFATMQARGQYVRMNAHEALWQFMVNGLPDEMLFRVFLDRLLGQAFKDGHRVRAFGEMVAILLAQGNVEGVIKLERLWHCICQEKQLTLYCAYSKRGFETARSGTIERVRAAHSRTLEP